MAKKTSIAPENIEHYTKLMTSVQGPEIKGATMPYTSMNGNMFSFLKEGRVGLRLPDNEREVFLKKYRSTLFETYGTVMKEYVTITPALMKKINEMKPYVKASYEYAKTLKAKPTKK